MSALNDRIAMMKETGIITDATAAKITAIQNMLLSEHSIELTEENAAPFITHIALAFERLEKGEEIDAMDDFIVDEIKASEDYPFSLQIANDICAMNIGAIALPESERICIIIHFINVLANIKG